MQGKYEAMAQTGVRGGKATASPWASTPDVASVISLNRFLAPVDDNVTANSTVTKSQSHPKRETLHTDEPINPHSSTQSMGSILTLLN